jgi:hypothetical protein
MGNTPSHSYWCYSSSFILKITFAVRLGKLLGLSIAIIGFKAQFFQSAVAWLEVSKSSFLLPTHERSINKSLVISRLYRAQ